MTLAITTKQKENIMIKRKSRIELFLSRKIKSGGVKAILLFIALFALVCIGMTLAHNDEVVDIKAKSCANEVFAFDNPKLCECK